MSLKGKKKKKSTLKLLIAVRGAKFLWRNKKKRPAKSHWASALPSPTEGHLL